MTSKTFIWIGMAVGSTVGSFIPYLWGAGLFSISSIILTALGGFAGIYYGFKLSQY
jgi:hypothetical protein